jgi:hypothetical protein
MLFRPARALAGSPFTPHPFAVIPRASGMTTGAGQNPGLACRQAIAGAERAAGIPTQLMAAIGRVESGRRDAQGLVHPWPWTINAEGAGAVFETKAAAIAAVKILQSKGVRSIDVGCMQVNLMHHPDAFASLEQAFDPVANAGYAARFLVQLHGQTGSWPQATALYHSATPDLGADYRRKVMAVWPEEQKRGRDTRTLDLAAAWAATLPNGSQPGRAAPVVIPDHTHAARIIPLAAGGTSARTLDAYRSAPIPVSGRRPLG